jgi:hypothetical protein
MRPDPSNSACRSRTWEACHFLNDVWDKITLVLDEAPAHPQDQLWAFDFTANQRNEQDHDHGGKVVALITEGTLGKGNYNRANVYFQWARVKLFNIPVAVGTGDDGCKKGADEGICNRQGAFPELNDLNFGRSLSPQPASQACDAGSKIRCVWSRPYSSGLDVVNPSPTSKTVKVALSTSGCRRVRDVLADQVLNGGRCVTDVTLTLSPWSGRPLQYE